MGRSCLVTCSERPFVKAALEGNWRDKSESILPISISFRLDTIHNFKYCHHQTVCRRQIQYWIENFLRYKTMPPLTTWTWKYHISWDEIVDVTLKWFKQSIVWSPGVATYKPACRQMIIANNQFSPPLPFASSSSSVFWAPVRSQMTHDLIDCDVKVLHLDQDHHQHCANCLLGSNSCQVFFNRPSTTLLAPLRKISSSLSCSDRSS